MGSIKGRLKHLVSQWLVKNLLKAVREDELLTLTTRGVYINRKKLTPEEVGFLKEEASALLESTLWHYMSKEVEYLAFLRMSTHAITADDLIFGKAMFYNLDLMRKFLQRCKAL